MAYRHGKKRVKVEYEEITPIVHKYLLKTLHGGVKAVRAAKQGLPTHIQGPYPLKFLFQKYMVS